MKNSMALAKIIADSINSGERIQCGMLLACVHCSYRGKCTEVKVKAETIYEDVEKMDANTKARWLKAAASRFGDTDIRNVYSDFALITLFRDVVFVMCFGCDGVRLNYRNEDVAKLAFETAVRHGDVLHIMTPVSADINRFVSRSGFDMEDISND